MSNEIFFDGKRFIPAADAGATADLTRDYIARLCRDGKMRGRRVGKNWYVEEQSFRDFLLGQEYAKSVRREELTKQRMQEYTGPRKPVSLTHDIAPAQQKQFQYAAAPAQAATISPIYAKLKDSVAQQSTRALSTASGALVSPSGFVDAAVRAAHVPVYAITPMMELVHKLTALALAVMLTFGTYALVDPHVAEVAKENALQSLASVTATYQTLTKGGVSHFADAVQTQVAAVAENPGASFAAAAQSIPDAFGALARAINQKVNALVYAIAFPQTLIASNSSGNVSLSVEPYARAYPSMAPVASATTSVSGSTRASTIQHIQQIERIVEAGGISEAQLNEKLNELNNKLVSQIYLLSSTPSSPPASGGYTNNIALTQRIDQLNGTKITGATISGGSISDASSLSVAGQTTLSTTTVNGDLTVNGILGVQNISLSSTTVTISGTSGQTANFFDIKNASGTTVFAVQPDGTLIGNVASTTQSYSQLLITGNATATNLVILNTASSSNFLGTNSTTTNATSTNAYATNLYAQNLTSYTAAVAPSFTATSSSATSTFAGGVTVGTNQLVVQQASGNVGIGTTSPFVPLSVNGSAFFTGDVTTNGNFTFYGGNKIINVSDGMLEFTNSAGNNFSLLSFGGTTASYPALKRNSAGLDLRLADDSGYANLGTANVNAHGTLTASSLATLSGGASTTLLSVTNTAYFGGTATTTIDSAGNITAGGNFTLGTHDFSFGSWTLNNTGWPGQGGFVYGAGGNITFGFSSSGSGTSNQASLEVDGAFIQGEDGKTNTYAGPSQFNNTITATGLSTLSGGASTTLLSATGKSYFGGTATTTIDSAGNVAAAGTLGVTGLTSLTGGASTTRLSVFNNAYFGATATSSFSSTGALTLASALGQSSGGTSFSTYTAGDILYADNSGNLAKLPIGATGNILQVQAGLPAWGVNSGGGGGSNSGTAWATTSLNLIYPVDTSYPVSIGANSTSSAFSIFEVHGIQYNSTKLGIATTSPATDLSVAGSGYFTGGLGVGVLNTTANTVNLASGGSYKINGADINTAGTLSNLGYLNQAQSWTGLNQFSNASSSLLSVTSKAYFGSTATSTFDSAGVLTLASALAYGSGGTGSTTAPVGQLLYGGTSAYQSVATSSLAVGSSLSVSGTLGYQVGGANSTISLNTANANNWTALQTFTNASSSLFSATSKAYFGSTATTTIDSAGNIVLPTSSTLGVGSSTPWGLLSVFAGGNYASQAASTLFAVGSSSAGTATTTFLSINSAGSVSIPTITNALLSTNGSGGIVATTTIGTNYLSANTISGISLGSNLADLTATNGTLTFSGNYNGGTARTIGLNLASANAWTGLQQFNAAASTTMFSAYNAAYFGATATSSFSSAGALTLATALTVPNGGTGQSTVTTGDLLYGSGTNAWSKLGVGTGGFVLGVSGGLPAWVATTTFSSGLAYSAGNVTNSGVLSIAGTANQITASASTGNITLSLPTLVSLTNASSSQFSVFTKAYFGSTATTTIDSAGNIVTPTGATLGVGSTTPWAQLSVFAGGDYLSHAASTLFAVGSSSAGTATSTFFSVASNGTVGVGTTSPWAQFSVNPNGIGTIPAFVVGSSTATWFEIDNGGNVGIGTTSPYRKLSVTAAVATAQQALAYDSTNKTELLTSSVGNYFIYPSGNNALVNNGNLWVCTGGSGNTNACPSGTPSGQGNLIIATALGIASSTPWAALSVGANGSIVTTEKSLSDGATIAVNWLQGNQQLVTLGGNRTVTFSNYIRGQILRLILCQDGTGSRTITWPTSILWNGGTAPTLTTTANKCDLMTFVTTAATGTTEILGAAATNF